MASSQKSKFGLMQLMKTGKLRPGTGEDQFEHPRQEKNSRTALDCRFGKRFDRSKRQRGLQDQQDQQDEDRSVKVPRRTTSFVVLDERELRNLRLNHCCRSFYQRASLLHGF